MNKNQPLFSILIAHYNNWEYFLDCYRSIENQLYKNFEIIIVDDCSTDGSYEKLYELAQNDNRIVLLRNEKNQGVGFTKKRCIDASKGQICGFLDPDDAVTADALLLSVDSRKKGGNYGVTYSKMMLCDQQLNAEKPFSRTKKIKNKDKWFFNIDTSVAHFFTFDKDVYQKTKGIDISLKSAVDQDLYLKLYEVTDFYYIDKPLYLYRLHSTGVSQGNQKSSAKDHFKKVLRNTMYRRNILKINGMEVSKLSDDELYHEIIRKHNSFFNKLFRKLSLF